MKAIPAKHFAVVKDQERLIIVDWGTFEYCDEMARQLNTDYQTTAYVAQGWNH